MKKRVVSALLASVMTAALVMGCGGNAAPASSAAGEETAPAEEAAPAEDAAEDATEETAEEAAPAAAGEGSVYYLNFKPEADAAWQDLAKAYTEETGVPVTVVTAASGEYETTLQAEMAKSEAPTLFQVNGPVGLKN